MYDVVALGESLIDFAPEGVNAAGVPLYSCNPGGALANLLAMIAKLGGKCAFMGKVGADAFGRFSFFRNPGADIMLTKEELSVHLLEQTQNFHFGSASLTDEPSRSAMSS